MSALAIAARSERARLSSPRARFARQLGWLVPGAVLPVVALPVGVLAVLRARTIMAVLGEPLGATIAVLILLAAGLAVVGYPIAASRCADAAAANGLPGEARRTYRCASVALGLLGVALLAVAVLAAAAFVWVIAKDRRARRALVLVKGTLVAGGTGLAVLAMAGTARRRARADELDFVLAERAEDRAAVFLFDQLDQAVEVAPRLRPGEAFLYSASGLTITTERTLDAPSGSCPSEEARATIAYLGDGALPADPLRGRLIERASRVLEPGEQLLAAVPGPKDGEGTVVTTRRLLALSAERVTKAVSLGEAATVRKVVGEDSKHLTLVIRGDGAAFRLAARPLDALVALRAVLRDREGSVFLPSLLAHV